MLSIFGSASHRELAPCSHCSRVSPPRHSQARPCVWQVTLSVTARSPWSLGQVGLEAQSGSSRAWPGSAFCCQVFAEGKASLARSAFLDTPSVSGLLSGRLKLGASLFAIFFFLFSVWTGQLMEVHNSMANEACTVCRVAPLRSKRWWVEKQREHVQ